MPISLLGICAAIASTGTPLRWQSNRPLIRCRLPGPQLPAQTAKLAGQVRFGAGGEGRGLLVPHVDPIDAPFRRSASVKPFSESPTTP